jgi:hypothetical protein
MGQEPINNDILEEKQSSPYSHLSWRYFGAFRCLCTVKCFFFGKNAPKRESNAFAEQAEALLTDVSNDETLKKGEQLLKLQREVENTRARRRLEHWACRVIVCYLLFVFVLILLNGASQIIFPQIFTTHGFISDAVMTVVCIYQLKSEPVY